MFFTTHMSNVLHKLTCHMFFMTYILNTQTLVHHIIQENVNLLFKGVTVKDFIFQRGYTRSTCKLIFKGPTVCGTLHFSDIIMSPGLKLSLCNSDFFHILAFYLCKLYVKGRREKIFEIAFVLNIIMNPVHDKYCARTAKIQHFVYFCVYNDGY